MAAQTRPRDFVINPFHPLAKGLVFAGFCDNRIRYVNSIGRVYPDCSPHRHHGDLGNSPLSNRIWIKEFGRFGMVFTTSSSARVTVPYFAEELGYGTQSFSISFYLQSYVRHISTLLDVRNTGNQYGILIYTGTSCNNKINIDINSKTFRNEYGPALNDNRYHHFVFIINRSTNILSYYLDNTLIAHINIGVIGTANIDALQPYRILGHSNRSDYTGVGVMFDWMHFSRAISRDEVSILANTKDPTFDGLITAIHNSSTKKQKLFYPSLEIPTGGYALV